MVSSTSFQPAEINEITPEVVDIEKSCDDLLGHHWVITYLKNKLCILRP